MTRTGTEIIVHPHAGGPIEVAHSNEDPQYPLTDEWGWETLSGGSRSESGERVTVERMLEIPAVWQAVTMISGDIAKLALQLFSRDGDGFPSMDFAHPASYLVEIQPNRETSAFKFWRRMMVQLLVWNNAYAFIAEDRSGNPEEILPLLPDRTTPNREGGTLVFTTEVNGRLLDAPASQVLHLEGICLDNVAGCDLVDNAREAWGLALAQMGFASKFFKYGGRIGGVLELPASATKKVRDKIAQGFEQTYGQKEAPFRTVILRENAKFHAAQRNFEETQLIESRKESVRDVARYYNIRPGRLGEESTVSYNSKSEDNRDYLDTTLSPHMALITSECGMKLLTDAERRSRSHFFQHDTDELLRLNPKERAETNAVLITSHQRSPNEVRKADAMPPYVGGDAIRNPNVETAGDGSPATADDDPPPPQASFAPHMTILNRAVAGRVQKIANIAKGRAGDGGARFLLWLDEGLDDHREPLAEELTPVVECILAASGCGDSAQVMAQAIAGDIVDGIKGGLNEIVNRVTEADLRAAVAKFMKDYDHEVKEFDRQELEV